MNKNKFSDAIKLLRTRELAAIASEHAGTDFEDTWEVIDNILAIIKEKLAQGEEISLPGIGKFTFEYKREREQYSHFGNIRQITPAYWKPIFNPSKVLFGEEDKLYLKRKRKA